MRADEESKTTLSKWPFVLGDVLLVAMALAIAVLGNWQLTNWQVAACVIAVALGAALFVLPYIVEFRVRIAEESEDRGGELRIIARQFESLEHFVETLDERLQRVEIAVEATAASGSGEDTLQKLADELKARLQAAAQRQTALADDLNRLKTELQDQIGASAELSGKSFAEWKAALSALESRIVDAQEFATLSERLAAVERAAAEATSPLTPSETPRREKGPVLERPTREPRIRRRPDEPRLLSRAINEKPQSADSAVSRIIESKGNGGAPPESVPDSPAAEPEKAPVAFEPALEVPPESDGAAADPLGEALPPAPVDPAEVDATPAPAEEATVVEETSDPDPADAPVEAGGLQGTPEPESVAVPLDRAEAAPSGFLFGEDPAPPAPKKARIRKEDTVVTASVFIGIGNKPYVRGSGGGLSWDKGQPMEFQEIGKWRWLASGEGDEPIELQIFRNDEDADKAGKFQLQPGQKLELSPVF